MRQGLSGVVNMSVTAIIVAAGASIRMGKPISKQLIPLNGTEVIIHTLKAFEKAESIDQVIIVCRNEDVSEISHLVGKNNILKVLKVVEGGNTRQESVQKGINAVGANTDYVAIHDGARPLILPSDIENVVANARKHCCSSLAVAVKNTIKLVDDNGFVEETPDRNKLISVQTPQVFELELYKQAAMFAAENKKDYTDDCQLIEAFGTKVHITYGDYTNIKVTTPEDVIVAENILNSR